MYNNRLRHQPVLTGEVWRERRARQEAKRHLPQRQHLFDLNDHLLPEIDNDFFASLPVYKELREKHRIPEPESSAQKTLLEGLSQELPTLREWHTKHPETEKIIASSSPKLLNAAMVCDRPEHRALKLEEEVGFAQKSIDQFASPQEPDEVEGSKGKKGRKRKAKPPPLSPEAQFRVSARYLSRSPALQLSPGHGKVELLPTPLEDPPDRPSSPPKLPTDPPQEAPRSQSPSGTTPHTDILMDTTPKIKFKEVDAPEIYKYRCQMVTRRNNTIEQRVEAAQRMRMLRENRRLARLEAERIAAEKRNPAPDMICSPSLNREIGNPTRAPKSLEPLLDFLNGPKKELLPPPPVPEEEAVALGTAPRSLAGRLVLSILSDATLQWENSRDSVAKDIHTCPQLQAVRNRASQLRDAQSQIDQRFKVLETRDKDKLQSWTTQKRATRERRVVDPGDIVILDTDIPMTPSPGTDASPTWTSNNT